MGREDGGGFRMGNTCIPVADIWQNQYNIVKLKNKIKLNKKLLIYVWSLLSKVSDDVSIIFTFLESVCCLHKIVYYFVFRY